MDLEALFPSGFDGVRLDAFRGFPPDLWSAAYFRANELTNLYVDFQVVSVLARCGGEEAQGKVAPERREEWEWLLAKAAQTDVTRKENGQGFLQRMLEASGDGLCAAILAEDAALEPVLALVDLAAAGYPDYLRGSRSGAQILFDERAASLWERYFDNRNPIYQPFNRLAAHAARSVLAGFHGACTGGLRILEAGAGCGSGSEELLAALADPIDLYLLTDISPNFLRKARERAQAAAGGETARIECRLLDLNRPPSGWRLDAESFDLVYAVNVLHAVRDLEATLRGLHAVLKPGAFLVLGECIRPRHGLPLNAEFIFQLLYEPRETRVQPEYRPVWGFLDAAGWRVALARSGFVEVAFIPDFEAAVAAYPEHSVAAIAARKPAGAARGDGAPR